MIKQNKTFKIILLILGVLLIGATAYAIWTIKKDMRENTSVKTQVLKGNTIESGINTTDWKTYRHQKLGFEFKYPPNAEVKVQNPGTIGEFIWIILTPNDRKDTWPWVQITYNSRFHFSSIADAKKEFLNNPEYPDYDKSEDVTVAGLPALHLTYNPDEQSSYYGGDTYYIVRHDRLFQIDFDHKNNNGSSLRDAFLSNFNFY